MTAIHADIARLNARVDELFARAAWHEHLAGKATEERQAIERALRDYRHARDRHRQAVLQRWRLRSAIRMLQRDVGAMRPLTSPASHATKARMHRKILIERLLPGLRELATTFDSRSSGPGVYVLFDGDEPVYVGQSINVAVRVAQHLGVKRFQRAAFIACGANKLNELERLFIDALMPRENMDLRTLMLRRAEGLPKVVG